MVKANNVDLSLDDIISKTRKTNSSIHKKPFGGGGGARRGNGRPTGIPRRSGGGGGWKDLDDERNHGITSRGNDNRTIRVNISNLAPGVISSDLEELFAEYRLQSISVNFNENGQSLGTGDISLSKRDADRLIQKFSGVALDGQMMKFAVIDSSIAGRVDFGNRSRSGNGNSSRSFQSGPRRFNKKPEDFLRDGVHEGDVKRGGSGRGGFRKGGKGGDRDSKPKKTEAELDAELEAYMAKRNA